MQKGSAHIFNVIRRSFVSALISFVLMLSASSFASARNLSQVFDNSATHKPTITQSQIGNQNAMKIMNSADCCNEDAVSCDDENCDIPCINFSSTLAILAPVSGGLHEQGLTTHTNSYTLKDGIKSILNAPPPRA